MLVEIPATFDVDLAEDFDYSFHTFSLAARFRWQVIERFSDQLEQTNEEDHGAVATVLSNLIRAIEAVRTESHNRGLRDLNQLLKRLPEPIRAAIRQASKAFESGFKSLQEARETNDLLLAQESFVLMRTSNFEFTRISLMNLTEIIDRNTRLPEIERLRPELKAAIPDAVRTRFEVTGNPPGGSGATTISTQLAQLTQPIAAIHQSSEDREASPASKPR